MLHMIFGLGFILVAVGIYLLVEKIDDLIGINTEDNKQLIPLAILYIIMSVVALLGLMMFIGGFAQTVVDLWFWIEGLV